MGCTASEQRLLFVNARVILAIGRERAAHEHMARVMPGYEPMAVELPVHPAGHMHPHHQTSCKEASIPRAAWDAWVTAFGMLGAV